MKNLKLRHEDIEPLTTVEGSCIATDRITVDGHPVSFMYRTQPTNNQDSGWCFFSGVDEDDEYVTNPENLGVYYVNTIANYDQSIIPYLAAPVGAVFERDKKSGEFIEVLHDYTSSE